jgi:hypothetical protein
MRAGDLRRTALRAIGRTRPRIVVVILLIPVSGAKASLRIAGEKVPRSNLIGCDGFHRTTLIGFAEISVQTMSGTTRRSPLALL